MDTRTQRRSWAAGGFAVLALAFASGCGGEEVQAGPSQSCSELQGECFANQKVCVEEGGAGRCEACASGSYASASGVCEAISGTPLSHDFAEFTVQPGEEIKGLCQSWTLNNSEEIWVNAVELTQDEQSHHSIWTYVPQDQFPGPDGVWPCKDRGYNELVGTIAGGVLYAQSTQATHEVQRFPAGAAVRIPPYARIISDIHLLNAGTKTVTGHAKLTVYGVPREEVTTPLVPFEMAFRALKIPPHAESRFAASCDLSESFQKSAGVPFDLKIHYILPHTHNYATRFYMNVYGGPRDGENIIDVEGFNYEARGRFYDEPIDLAGAKGLTFGCEYMNPTNDTLGWAFEEEMCQMLGFAESKVAFLSAVWESSETGEEKGMQVFSGPCQDTAIPWDFDKPGGTPTP